MKKKGTFHGRGADKKHLSEKKKKKNKIKGPPE